MKLLFLGPLKDQEGTVLETSFSSDKEIGETLALLVLEAGEKALGVGSWVCTQDASCPCLVCEGDIHSWQIRKV